MSTYPCIAIIIENPQKEVLLLLRDDKPGIAYPNCWSLVGGHAEDGETAEQAAARELLEEIGLELELTVWKRYDYLFAPDILIDQTIFTAQVGAETPAMTLGEGQAMQFFKHADLEGLKIGFDFDKILNEYFETQSVSRK